MWRFDKDGGRGKRGGGEGGGLEEDLAGFRFGHFLCRDVLFGLLQFLAAREEREREGWARPSGGNQSRQLPGED